MAAMGDGGAVNMECGMLQKHCAMCGCCDIAEQCAQVAQCAPMSPYDSQPGFGCGKPGASRETVKSNMESVDDNSTMAQVFSSIIGGVLSSSEFSANVTEPAVAVVTEPVVAVVSSSPSPVCPDPSDYKRICCHGSVPLRDQDSCISLTKTHNCRCKYEFSASVTESVKGDMLV